MPKKKKKKNRRNLLGSRTCQEPVGLRAWLSLATTQKIRKKHASVDLTLRVVGEDNIKHAMLRHKPLQVSHKPLQVSHKPLQVSHKPLQVSHKPLQVSHKPLQVSHKPLQVSRGAPTRWCTSQHVNASWIPCT